MPTSELLQASEQATPPSPACGALTVSIGEHHVGAGCPCFIIAEAGVNHNGSLARALRMVDVASDAGADAIKFQMFAAAALVTSTATTARYQRAGSGHRSQRDMLARLELSLDDFATIRRHCEQREITFLATPFGPAEVARLTGLGAEALKIASTDLTNQPLLKVAASTNLPILLSTGASTKEEIEESVSFLASCAAGNRLILLHCISCYPTSIDAINLRAISGLSRRFSAPAGLSDHTTSVETGGWAVSAGACVLEKHFTLNARDRGPDHAVSLNPAQLAQYVTAARRAQRALGNGEIGMTDEQAEVRRVAGKSLVAAIDIGEGVTITRDMLTLKRPGTGLAIDELSKLTGRSARTFIPSDTLLAWDMVR